MKTKDVIVIGAGIAGCATALALAKHGVSVTIISSNCDQRVYHAPFIQHDQLESQIQRLQESNQQQLVCPRAYEQLVQCARSSVDDLLETHYLVDRNGNIDIYRCLQEQLQKQSCVEWVTNHSLLDLLTLDRHSPKTIDRYKKPTCVGISTYNYDSQQIEYLFAKETILATGGATSLFIHSINPATAYGGGLAIAHLAGVRLLNMGHVQFHPLGLFEKERPCFPLPLELLSAGGKLHDAKNVTLKHGLTPQNLMQQMYCQLLATQNAHLWLDLTSLDSVSLKEQFPAVDAYCLNHGFNIAKDQLPIVPTAYHTCGGIAVDRVGQTNIQRLRAVGSIASTGVFYNCKEEALALLESLTWAKSCADDIFKQISKLVYYFPESTPPILKLESESTDFIEEDWHMLRNIMWSYVGICRDMARLERGHALLEQLRKMNRSYACLRQRELLLAIHTARLIIEAAMKDI